MELTYQTDQVKVLNILDQAQSGTVLIERDDLMGKVNISDSNSGGLLNADKSI